MTIDRLRTLLDAYGADPTRWPAAERASALALLERSSEARRLRAEAARLDAVLDAAPAPAPSPALARHVLARAPRPATLRRARWALAAAPLAGAAVVAFWLVRTRAPTPQPRTLPPLAALGRYETPTDALLGSDELDVWNGVPTLTCPASDLGCLDLDDENRAATQPLWRTHA